jgi:hypothetical protein
MCQRGAAAVACPEAKDIAGVDVALEKLQAAVSELRAPGCPGATVAWRGDLFLHS